jgi:hypothetical protein
MELDSRPFILYGHSQLEVCRGQMERALGAWLQNWFNDLAVIPQLTIAPLEKGAQASFDGQVWHRLDMDADSLYLHFDGFQEKEFLPLLFGLSREDHIGKSNEGVHWEIVRELLNDFVCRWRKPATTPEVLTKPRWEYSTPPGSFYERGSGALLLRLLIGEAVVKFIVPPEILRWLPLELGGAINKRPISRVSEVLGRESIRLLVTIDAAEAVPFRALSDLNVGDVILLNRKVQEPFNLINGNGARLGGCHIGRRGESRAIHIAASAAAVNSKGMPSKS